MRLELIPFGDLSKQMGPPQRKQFWDRHLWARGYLAVSSGNITDEAVQKYIEEQESEPVADKSRFQRNPS